MPAEERKFKRRRIVALLPVCKRDRDEAESHAETTNVPAMGREVEDGNTVAVELARAVAVGSGTFVIVGETREGPVDIAELVSIEEESRVPADMDTGFVVREDKGI